MTDSKKQPNIKINAIFRRSPTASLSDRANVSRVPITPHIRDADLYAFSTHAT